MHCLLVQHQLIACIEQMLACITFATPPSVLPLAYRLRYITLGLFLLDIQSVR